MTKLGIEKNIAIEKLGNQVAGFWSIKHMTLAPQTGEIILHIYGWSNQSSFEANDKPMGLTQMLKHQDLDDLGVTDSTTIAGTATAVYTALLSEPEFVGGNIIVIEGE